VEVTCRFSLPRAATDEAPPSTGISLNHWFPSGMSATSCRRPHLVALAVARVLRPRLRLASPAREQFLTHPTFTIRDATPSPRPRPRRRSALPPLRAPSGWRLKPTIACPFRPRSPRS